MYPAELIISGRQRAHELAARLDDAPDLHVQDYPQRVGAGWFRFRLILTGDELAALLRDFTRDHKAVGIRPAQLVEVLADLAYRDPDAVAIGAVGDRPPATFVATLADGRLTQTAFGDQTLLPVTACQLADPAATLADWSIHAPKHLTASTARQVADTLAHAKGATAATQLMRRLGFDLNCWDPNADLGGYRWDPGITVHPTVGLTEIDLNTTRYVAGRGEGFAGIWDRDNPSQPIETWPDTHDGRAAMARRRFELVEAAIFAETLCLGERRWAPVREGDIRSYSPLPPAALVWIHEGNGGMVDCYERPSTRGVFREGMLGRARRVSTIDDAMAFGAATLKTRQAGPWQPVPDDVPRPLLETNAWVRAAAGGWNAEPHNVR